VVIDKHQTQPASAEPEPDPLALRGLDHLEFYVGNAYQAAQFYRLALGFDIIAYAGPETGVRDRASYVLAQGDVRFVVTAALGPDTPVAEQVGRHGDTVHRIALGVDDASRAFEVAVQRGARPAREPTRHEGTKGHLTTASIHAYGDVVHTFVDRGHYEGVFMPGFHRRRLPGQAVGFTAIDHVVGNVELGKMNEWVAFYRDVMGFRQLVHFDDKDISTEYSALMSKVMHDGSGRIKFPINEPAEGRRKSQIQEYLEFHQGPGVQHIALLTDDIVAAVARMRANGVDFLRTPATYYEQLPARIGQIAEDMAELERLGILVDRDDEGYLLQIFTRPVEDRPTIFFEIIQRRGSQGFGKGNFKALFEAIEIEQRRRGNL
jgi:4-hydroxyphenylpyruvate dioxygenase